MTSLLITGGRLIDPSQALDRTTNVLIEEGRIAAYDAAPAEHHQVIEAAGCIVSPGLIDLNCQLREPGHEEDETIATGTAAAVAGGYTTIACLPNTEPPIDSQAGVEFIRHQAEQADNCHVLVMATVSKGRGGEELAEIGTLVEAGAAAFTDAQRPINNPDLLRRALQYCLMFDKPVMSHPEAPELSHSGVMHEGKVSLVLALSAMPAEAEDVMTARDIRLAETTGGRLHLMNISTGGSVDIIRRAKARGVRVTSEVTPHHLALTDKALRSFDSNCKVNPPLRSAEHVEALIGGLVDGTIDVIASGHAPRASEKKMIDIEHAPYGMVSLETALALAVTTLIEPGHLDWPVLLAKLSTNPAGVMGIDKGTLQIGAAADVTIIDPAAKWTADPSQFASRSSNTPFGGWELTGRATHTIVGGVVKRDSPRLSDSGGADVLRH